MQLIFLALSHLLQDCGTTFVLPHESYHFSFEEKLTCRSSFRAILLVLVKT
jgi:hypothetical protein